MLLRRITQSFADVAVTTLQSGSNYMYMITWGKWAAVVDPTDADPVLHVLKKQRLQLVSILVTHPHTDHFSGNFQLKNHTNCSVVGSSRARIPGLERIVRNGDTFKLGALTVNVLGTPGHGRQDICYYIQASGERPGLLWTGDTLFLGGCGRVLSGDLKTMWKSLGKLAALPDDTLVYCGHEYTVDNYEFARKIEPKNKAVRKALREAKRQVRLRRPTVPTTIGKERSTNLFMRAGHPEIKKALGMEDASDVEVFTELRRRKDRR